MKKLSVLLMSSLLMFGATSCLDNKDDIYSYQQAMYSRVIGGSATPYFSQGSTTFSVNYDAKTISISATVRLSESSNIAFEINNMPMTSKSGGLLYSFTSQPITVGGHDINALYGEFDSNTATTYIEYLVDGKYRVYSTSMPLFLYASTTCTANNGAVYTSQDMAYAFGIGSDNKAKFAIYNFRMNDTETALDELDLSGVDVAVTPDGYKLSAEQVTAITPSSDAAVSSKKVEITDFTATVTDQGRTITGSFKTTDGTVTFIGYLFAGKTA